MNDQVTIEVIGENNLSNQINVNLNSSKMTLATILADYGIVEAACQEKLSCCTCVGGIETIPNGVLSQPTEDELDITDTVIKSFSVEGTQVRAGCQIILQPGVHYKFTSLNNLSKLKTQVSNFQS
ncbi:unnamed protein product [Rotaria sordida]|uniref:Ferredoxin n=1 Tax=Rotaria sordida TaxID=392033 RepID=A0A814T3F5_9BILA|nr:unnamed protein product [Rotaria sordida]